MCFTNGKKEIIKLVMEQWIKSSHLATDIGVRETTIRR